MLCEVESTADDLLDNALVQIDAWPEGAATSLIRHFECSHGNMKLQHLQ